MPDPPYLCSPAEVNRLRAHMGAGGDRQVDFNVRVPSALPSALDNISALSADVAHQRRRVVFFLDYDGTLSPIVENPEHAVIPDRTRQALSIVSSRFTTAIVTGRAKKKIMSMVNLEQLIYAGSHGFDIEGPKGLVSHSVANEYLPSLRSAYDDLLQLSKKYPGSSVEDNYLSISFHYRMCSAHVEDDAKHYLLTIVDRYGLKLTKGKMVWELRPRTDWHKGKAVQFLLNGLELEGPDVLPIYIGDDVTDEDAFGVLRGKGISVIVSTGETKRETLADMRLNDPNEVQDFLMHFAENESFSPPREEIVPTSD